MRTKGIWLAISVSAMTACGGGQSGDSHPTSEHGASSTGEGGERDRSAQVALQNSCILMMHREQSCNDLFLPALVALRVRMDHPAGIAARDAADHDALMLEASQEYARDATDEQIATTCREAMDLPAAETTGWTDQADACLTFTDCQAFVDCDMQFTEARFHAAMRHQAERAAAAAADAGTPAASQ